MAKLWQKDVQLAQAIDEFTVGDDTLLDQELVVPDCVASMAHADMLASIGILTRDEAAALKKELLAIAALAERGRFPISLADEDCHTAIENALTERLGELGKKIHTGRSRNDQVIAALRLRFRGLLLAFEESGLGLVETLLAFARKHEKVPMPGRTHMQIAMPSSVGLWAAAFAEQVADDLALFGTAYELNNRSPLGSAASYGVPLPLDREQVAASLGFAEVQNNVLAVNNSRGKTEAILLDAASQVMITLSKLAQDLILFSMPEFAYFDLPAEICPGSSIMPQKKNPGPLEIIRARAATVIAAASQVKETLRGLPSGYNQDYQETKGAFFRGFGAALASVRVMGFIVPRLGVNESRLLAGFSPEIFATDRALELVKGGMPFREAYREVGKHLAELEKRDPRATIADRTSSGTAGNLRLDLAAARLAARRARLDAETSRLAATLAALVGGPAPLPGAGFGPG